MGKLSLFMFSTARDGVTKYTYRVPQCLSPRWNWDPATPTPAQASVLPPGTKGGNANSDD